MELQAAIGVILITVGGILTPFALWILTQRRRMLQAAEDAVMVAKKRAGLLVSSAESEASAVRSEAESNARQLTEAAKARVERLKVADKEIVERLRLVRAELEALTDRSGSLAATVDLVSDADLMGSAVYQADRKRIRSRLSKMATDAFMEAEGHASDVNIGKFVAVSAKADMAGALLLTTVEMLAAKVTSNNGHASLEKLNESVHATEALVNSMDSRATVRPEFVALLAERLVAEINYKKAKEKAKEEQRALREQEREERKARQ
jgi:hypothetical protein